MFRFGNALERRLSISHQDGSLVISIQRNNQWALYILLLAFFTGIFVTFCLVFFKAFFRIHSAVGALYLLPFVLFIMVWYAMAIRLGLWRAFGVEEIVIKHGKLQWKRTAGWWRRNFEASVSEISTVEARTPWHALSNRVEFSCKGRRYTIGDMLQRDEANEIAIELELAAGLHGRS